MFINKLTCLCFVIGFTALSVTVGALMHYIASAGADKTGDINTFNSTQNEGINVEFVSKGDGNYGRTDVAGETLKDSSGNAISNDDENESNLTRTAIKEDMIIEQMNVDFVPMGGGNDVETTVEDESLNDSSGNTILNDNENENNPTRNAINAEFVPMGGGNDVETTVAVESLNDSSENIIEANPDRTAKNEYVINKNSTPMDGNYKNSDLTDEIAENSIPRGAVRCPFKIYAGNYHIFVGPGDCLLSSEAPCHRNFEYFFIKSNEELLSTAFSARKKFEAPLNLTSPDLTYSRCQAFIEYSDSNKKSDCYIKLKKEDALYYIKLGSNNNIAIAGSKSDAQLFKLEYASANEVLRGDGIKFQLFKDNKSIGGSNMSADEKGYWIYYNNSLRKASSRRKVMTATEHKGKLELCFDTKEVSDQNAGCPKQQEFDISFEGEMAFITLRKKEASEKDYYLDMKMRN